MPAPVNSSTPTLWGVSVLLPTNCRTTMPTFNNANIRRIAQRIKDLEKVADRPEFERSGPGYTYREDPQESRAMFLFDCKPAKETCGLLKRHGFRWSPTRSAWVRQLTGNAQWPRRISCVP